MRKNNRGISLLEVIVVIGIIIALIGLIMPAISIVRNNGKETETSAEMTQLDTALIAFFSDKGCFPESGQLLSLNSTYFSFDPNRRAEGDIYYKDKWGEEYLYLCPGIISSKGYDLFSSGLLKSQGDSGTLGGILSALNSTINSSSTGSGTPPGLGGQIIWGLPKPEYNDLVKAMLALLRSTDTGFNLAIMINIAHIPIELADLSGTGALADYNPSTHVIRIDISLALEGPIEAVTALLAHEATHLADNLANGSRDFDSIEEEYDAFYNAAIVWKDFKDDRGVPLEDNALTKEMDSVQEFIEKGDEVAKEIIRQLYHSLPEKDQYGDSYVVAKKY